MQHPGNETLALLRELLTACEDGRLVDRTGSDGRWLIDERVRAIVEAHKEAPVEEVERIEIAMTDMPPLSIVDAEWPVIVMAQNAWHDNQYRSQANRTRDIFIKVRAHADGRHIVYAGYDFDSHYQGERGAQHRTGELIEAGEDVVAAIKRVAGELAERAGPTREIFDCMNECIADLPAVAV